MSELTTVITTITTTYIPSVLNTITGNAVLLVGVGFFVIGGCVGLVKRMFHAH